MLRMLLRITLLFVGLFGVLLFVAGLLATISGTSIALPGLGLIVAGPVFLVLGLLIIVGVGLAFWSLKPRQILP